MAHCRFFEGEHTYTQDECDPSHCWHVLGGISRKRKHPLIRLPNPDECEHEWEDILARVSVVGGRRCTDPRCLQVQGVVVMVERRIHICLKCGMVRYSHENLGDLCCVPTRPRHK